MIYIKNLDYISPSSTFDLNGILLILRFLGWKF